MEINWKVVAPIALIAGAIVLYFVRVKPIEGLENADKEFASKVKERLAELEAWRKYADKERDMLVKKLGTDDYKELLKTMISIYDMGLTTQKMKAVEKFVELGLFKGQEQFDKTVKSIDGQSKVLDYARTSLSVLNGTDGQGSGIEAAGAVDNSSGTSPSLW